MLGTHSRIHRVSCLNDTPKQHVSLSPTLGPRQPSFPPATIEPEHLLLALIQHHDELMGQLLPETDLGAMTAAVEAAFTNPRGL
jgi:hypothetical protein